MRELFNAYGNSYDDHVKKLLYQVRTHVIHVIIFLFISTFYVVNVVNVVNECDAMEWDIAKSGYILLYHPHLFVYIILFSIYIPPL